MENFFFPLSRAMALGFVPIVLYLVIPTFICEVLTMLLIFNYIGNLLSRNLSIKFVSSLVFWTSFILLIGLVDAACPRCQGALSSCKYASDGACILDKGVSDNVTALAAGAAATITLVGMLSTRLTRCFPPQAVEHIFSLSKRPEPGTMFTMTSSSTLSDVLTAVRQEQIAPEFASIQCYSYADKVRSAASAAGRVMTDLEKEQVERHLSDAKVLREEGQKRVSTASPASSASIHLGVFSYIWAMTCSFIRDEGMNERLTMEDINPSEPNATSRRYYVRYVRLESFPKVAEALHLFQLYVVAFGLLPFQTVAEFIQQLFWDSLRRRGLPWEMCTEKFFIALRKVEDSAGRLTFFNLTSEVHMNGLDEEVCHSCTLHYPGRSWTSIFRWAGGARGSQNNDVDDATNDNGKKVWNKKFPKDDGKGCPCAAFNEGRDHRANELRPDGTCKKPHVCFHWISSGGPGGRCRRSHPASKCDHPDKCADKVQ